MLGSKHIGKLQTDLIENAKNFSNSVVELALPIRLGLCAILTTQAASIMNSKLLDLIKALKGFPNMLASAYNEQMKNPAARE